LLATATASLLAASAPPALGATIVVTSTNDSGPGSLRQAITAATSGETIVVPASASHYAVTSAPLLIEKSLTITGAGASASVIDAMQSKHRVLEIKAGTVTLSGVTITGAKEAPENGAGMEIEGSANVTLSKVTVSGNTVEQIHDGGGIESFGGTTLTIDASTIADNVGYNGGGVEAGGTTVITNSTIVGNHGGDKANNGDGGGVEGGPSMTLVNDTIVGNECFNGEGCGGGLDSAATVKNTIIADNLAGSTTSEEIVQSNCNGTVTDTGPNLESGSECAFGAHGGLSSTNPLLTALGNHGGPTETMVPLAGSPVIDHGTNSGCPVTDQRGIPRPQGLACDIGAVEHTVPSAGAPTVSAVTGTSATLTATAGTVLLGGTFSYRFGTTTAYGSSTPAQALFPTLGAEPPIPIAEPPEQAKATLTGLTPGTLYHAQLVVSNPDGTATSGDVSFTTAAAPSASPPLVPPTVSDVRQTAARWREGRQLALVSSRHKRSKRKPPVGTRFTFTLNEPAAVSLSFSQRVSGRKVGHKCVAATPKNREHRACERTATPGSLSFSGHSGMNKVVFQGRISRTKKLKPGHYTLVITATNGTGQKSAPQKLGFTIVK
jgi:hypothetical protein